MNLETKDHHYKAQTLLVTLQWFTKVDYAAHSQQHTWFPRWGVIASD